MKHLLTAIACCLGVAGSAQAPNPDWNPDFNADEIIGATDLLGLLSTFGDEWSTPEGPVIVNLTPELMTIGNAYEFPNSVDIIVVQSESFLNSDYPYDHVNIHPIYEYALSDTIPFKRLAVCLNVSSVDSDDFDALFVAVNTNADSTYHSDVTDVLYYRGCKSYMRIQGHWYYPL